MSMFRPQECPQCGKQHDGATFKEHGLNYFMGIYMHDKGGGNEHPYAHVVMYQTPAITKELGKR